MINIIGSIDIKNHAGINGLNLFILVDSPAEVPFAVALATLYTAHQDGIAEKANYVVEEKVRVMLIETQLPPKLWPEVPTEDAAL